MRRFWPVIIAVLVGTPCFAGNLLRVHDARVHEAPPTAQVLAGYMTLENPTANDMVLVRVTSAQFGTVEIHRTVERGDLTGMEYIAELAVPANGRVVLEPGSYHLMLMKPVQPLRAGDRVSLVLHFSSGSTQTVIATVRRTAEEASHEH